MSSTKKTAKPAATPKRPATKGATKKSAAKTAPAKKAAAKKSVPKKKRAPAWPREILVHGFAVHVFDPEVMPALERTGTDPYFERKLQQQCDEGRVARFGCGATDDYWLRVTNAELTPEERSSYLPVPWGGTVLPGKKKKPEGARLGIEVRSGVVRMMGGVEPEHWREEQLLELAPGFYEARLYRRLDDADAEALASNLLQLLPSTERVDATPPRRKGRNPFTGAVVEGPAGPPNLDWD